MSRIKLLFFATLRDQVGTRTAELEIPDGTTVQSLKETLVDKYPALKASLPTALIAVNREFSQGDTVLEDGAEVALFPPVSGG